MVTRSLAGARSVIADRGLVTDRLTTPTVTPGDPDPTPDPPAAAVISDIVVSDITTSGATIRWNLAVPGPGWVEFGTADGGPYPSETTHEDSFDYASHAQNITGQADETPIYFKVVAPNGVGEITRSSQQSFTTAAGTPEDPPPPDPGPGVPIFGTITESSLTDTGCTLTIPVDQPVQMYVVYDTSSGTVEGDYPNATNAELSFTYSTHAQRISGIAPGTEIFYRAVATNAAAQTTLSAEGSFTTTGAEPDPPAEDELPAAIDPMVYTTLPAQTAPALLAVTMHPAYGTEVTRVSAVDGQRHRYSSKPTWSCTEEWATLDYMSGNRALLNGQTLAIVKNSNDTGGSFTWSMTVGNKGYAYGLPRTIRVLTASSSGLNVTSSHTMTALSGTYEAINLGGYYGVGTHDDRYYVFVYKKTNGWHGVAVFDTTTMLVVAERDIKNDTRAYTEIIGYCSMSPNGDHVAISTSISGSGGEGTALWQGAWILDFGNGADPTLSVARQVTVDSGHMDVAELTDGTQVLVMVSQNSGGGDSGGYAGYYEMATGDWVPVLSSFPNGHTSARCHLLPGKVVFTSFSLSGTFPGRNEIFMMDLDDPGRAIRFAHMHFTVGGAYNQEPHGCVSPTGSRVIWVAQWDGSGGLYSFVAGLDVIR